MILFFLYSLKPQNKLTLVQIKLFLVLLLKPMLDTLFKFTEACLLCFKYIPIHATFFKKHSKTETTTSSFSFTFTVRPVQQSVGVVWCTGPIKRSCSRHTLNSLSSLELQDRHHTVGLKHGRQLLQPKHGQQLW